MYKTSLFIKQRALTHQVLSAASAHSTCTPILCFPVCLFSCSQQILFLRYSNRIPHGICTPAGYAPDYLACNAFHLYLAIRLSSLIGFGWWVFYMAFFLPDSGWFVCFHSLYTQKAKEKAASAVLHSSGGLMICCIYELTAILLRTGYYFIYTFLSK